MTRITHREIYKSRLVCPGFRYDEAIVAQCCLLHLFSSLRGLSELSLEEELVVANIDRQCGAFFVANLEDILCEWVLDVA